MLRISTHTHTRHACGQPLQVSNVGFFRWREIRPIQQRFRSPISIVQLGQELADASTGFCFRIFPSRERRPSVATATPPLSRDHPNKQVYLRSHWFACNMPHAQKQIQAIRQHHRGGRNCAAPTSCQRQTNSVVMILPQVHLRKPCYDFTFL